MEPLDALGGLDIAIDGADQIGPDGWLVKGGGAAHTREKVVFAAARRFVVSRAAGHPRRTACVFTRIVAKDIFMNVGEDVRQPPVREVVDIRALRALAHPFRVKLYELVGREGTLTTTQASGLTGESPASCSYHLRQLAKYGFIEEAPRGSGRERPWRRTSAANDFRRLASDPGFAEAAALAAAIGAEQYLTQLRAFLSNPDDTSPEWRDRSFLHDSLLYLTLDELADLKRDVLGLMARYQQRTLDPAQRPATSRPIAILATGFPLPPTPAGN